MSAGGIRRGIGAIWKRYDGPPLPDDPEAQRRALDSYRVRRYDLQDAINQLLGRDPEQHRPPRLAWDALMRVLHEDGTDLGEEELIADPVLNLNFHQLPNPHWTSESGTARAINGDRAGRQYRAPS